MSKKYSDKYRIWNKTIAMVMVCLFIVNDMSFALGPAVTSDDMGEQLRHGTREEMINMGHELLTSERGRCAIGFDSYESGVDENPDDTTLRPEAASVPAVKYFDFLRDHSPKGEASFETTWYTASEEDYNPLVNRLIRLDHPVGGVGISVGPDQNLSLMSAIDPELWIIIDISRQVTELLLPGIFGLTEEADTPEKFVELFGMRDRVFWDRFIGRVYPPELQPRAKEFWGRFHSGVYGIKARGYETVVETWTQAGNWLSTQERYDVVRRLWREGRIRAVSGDWSKTAPREAAKYLQEENKKVRVFYQSNLGWWGGAGWWGGETGVNQVISDNLDKIPRETMAYVIDREIGQPNKNIWRQYEFYRLDVQHIFDMVFAPPQDFESHLARGIRKLAELNSGIIGDFDDAIAFLKSSIDCFKVARPDVRRIVKEHLLAAIKNDPLNEYYIKALHALELSGHIQGESPDDETIIDSRPGLRELITKLPHHRELLIELSSPSSLGVEVLRAGFKKDLTNFDCVLDRIAADRKLFNELASGESIGIETLRAGFVSDIMGFDASLDSISARREIFDKLSQSHALGLGALRTVFRDNPWGIHYILDELHHSYELFDELIASGSIGLKALRARFIRNPLRFAKELMSMHSLDRAALRSILPLFHSDSFDKGLASLRNLTMHKEYAERMAILSAASSIIMLRLNKYYDKLCAGDCTAITLTYLAKLLDNDVQATYDDLDKIVQRCILHKEVFKDQATSGGKIHLDIDIGSEKARAVKNLALNLGIIIHVYSEAATRIGNLELHLQPMRYTAGLNDILVSFIKLGIFDKLDLIGVNNMAIGEDGRPVEYPKTILLQPTLRVDGHFWNEKNELRQEPRLMSLGLLLSDPYDVEYKDKIPDEIDTYGPIIEGGGILHDSEGRSEIHDERSRADLWGIARIGPADVSAIEAGEDAAFSKIYERYYILGSAILTCIKNKDKVPDEISPLDMDISNITRSFLEFMKDTLMKLELYEAFVGESWNKGNWPKLKKLLDSVGMKKGIRAKLEMVEINDGEYRPEIVLAAKKDKNARAMSAVIDEVLGKYVEEIKLAHIIDFARRLKDDDSLEAEEKVSLVYDAIETVGFTLGNELEVAKFHSALETALTLGLDIQYEEIEFVDDSDSGGEYSSDAIGKFIKIESIRLDSGGRLQGKIENIDTGESLELSRIPQKRAPPEDVEQYIRSIERLVDKVLVTSPQGKLLRNIISQFRSNPPKDIVIIQETEARFFGIGRQGLLVITQNILQNPVSFLHEMMEYLKYTDPNLIGNVEGLIGESGREWLLQKERKYKDGVRGEYFTQNRAHYVIRAFTRQVFGEEDLRLTRDIKLKQLFDRLENSLTQAYKSSQGIEVKRYDMNTLTDISKGVRAVNDKDLGLVVMAGMDEMIIVETNPEEKAAILAPEHHICLSCDIRARKGDRIIIGHVHVFPGSGKGNDFDNIPGGAFEKYKRALDFLTNAENGLSDIQLILSPDARMRGLPTIQEMQDEANNRGIQTFVVIERPEFIAADALNTVNNCVLRIKPIHNLAKSEFHVTEWTSPDDSGGIAHNSAVNSKSVTQSAARLTIDGNVSCGTICEDGHEGSYQSLDGQLTRQFDKFRKNLGLSEERILTEIESDKALAALYPQFAKNIVDSRSPSGEAAGFRGNDIGVTNELQNLRETLRKGAKIPDEINIFFSIPEGGTELFWVGDDYAAGHFNKAGSRIHISLPFIRKRGTAAAIAVTRHEVAHIQGEGHQDDDGFGFAKEAAKEKIVNSRPGLRELMGGDSGRNDLLIELSSPYSLGRDTLLTGFVKDPRGFDDAIDKIYRNRELFDSLQSSRSLGIDTLRTVFSRDPRGTGRAIDEISHCRGLFDELQSSGLPGIEALRAALKGNPRGFTHGLAVMANIERSELNTILPLFHPNGFEEGLANLRSLTKDKGYRDRMTLLSAASFIILLRVHRDYNRLRSGDCAVITLTYLAMLLDDDGQATYSDLDEIVKKYTLLKEIFDNQMTSGGKIYLNIGPDSEDAAAVKGLADVLDINTQHYSWAARQGGLELHLKPSVYTAGLTDVIRSLIKLGVFEELDLISTEDITIAEGDLPREYLKTIPLQPSLRVDGLFWDGNNELREEPRLMALGLLLTSRYDAHYRDDLPETVDTYSPIVKSGGALYDEYGRTTIHNGQRRANLWSVARIGPADVIAIEAGKYTTDFGKIYERYHLLGNAILVYIENKDKSPADMNLLDLDIANITRSFLDFMKDTLLELELYEAFVGESWNKGNWPRLKRLLELTREKKDLRATLEFVEVGEGEYKPRIALADKGDQNAQPLSVVLDDALNRYIEDIKLAHVIDYGRRLKDNDRLRIDEKTSLASDALLAAGFSYENPSKAIKFLSALEAVIALGLDIPYDNIELEIRSDLNDDSTSDAIGKFIEIKPIEVNPEGRLQGIIMNIDTKERVDLSEIAQERTPLEDVEGYVRNVERLLEETTLTGPQRELLNNIITQFKAKPPKDIIITRGVEAGFFGIGKPGLLVIDQSLLNNPISFLHEMIEYLKHYGNRQEIINQIKALLDDPARKWLKRHEHRHKGISGNLKRNNAHYIIRAFTRQVFGDRDRALTRNIKDAPLYAGSSDKDRRIPRQRPEAKRIGIRLSSNYLLNTDKAARQQILQKFPGWELLDSALGQENLTRTINSEWGFVYAHLPETIEHYFRAFEKARAASEEFANGDKTFFVTCSDTDHGVKQKVAALAKNNNYHLFVYDGMTKRLRHDHVASDSRVTIILDSMVPRKFFSSLFLYSDDLPTVVTGQDNLANIIYMNHLSSGRPFFWEVLSFQYDAESSLYGFLRKQINDKFVADLKGLWNTAGSEPSDEAARMFISPKDYREFFKKMASAINEHPAFLPQLHYLILRALKNKIGLSYSRAETLIAAIKGQRQTQNIWNTVNLLHESHIEILIPQKFKPTEAMMKAIKDIKKRNGTDIVNLREYSGKDQLKILLKRKTANGIKRIIITDEGASHEVEAAAEENIESFRDVRLVNVMLPGNYQSMDADQKTIYQSKVIMIAILARLLEKGSTPMVEALLGEMLKDHLKGVSQFIDKLGLKEDSAASLDEIKERIQYFLTKPVSLIAELEQRMMFIKEFWTCA